MLEGRSRGAGATWRTPLQPLGLRGARAHHRAKTVFASGQQWPVVALHVVQRFRFNVGVVNLATTVADFQKLLMGDDHGISLSERNPMSKRCGYWYGAEHTRDYKLTVVYPAW